MRAEKEAIILTKKDDRAIDIEQTAFEDRLGLKLSDSLKQRVLREPWLAHHLLVVSENKKMLSLLISRMEQSTESNYPSKSSSLDKMPPKITLKQSLNAIQSVAGAVLWKSSRTTYELREKRLSICQKCPNLNVSVNDSSIKKINKFTTCLLCGCFVELKVRIATENCPCPSSNDSNMSLWGEPI